MGLPELWYEIREADGEQVKADWVARVQQEWAPLQLTDRIIVALPHHTDADIATAQAHKPACQVIRVVGGEALGCGDHSTTVLCAQWLQSKVRSLPPSCSVLDYGAGSGVLAFVAALSGVQGRVDGVELDAAALDSACANAELNGLASVRFFRPGHGAPGADSPRARQGPHPPLPASHRGRYNIVVANIISLALGSCAPTLAALARPGAWLGLSGVLEGQVPEVQAAYGPWFGTLRVVTERDGWVLLEGVRCEG